MVKLMIGVIFQSIIRKTGNSKEGSDLDYIKAAMDSENAYFILKCSNSNWDSGIVFEINFDYIDGTKYNGPKPEGTDIHTNYNPGAVYFWSGDVTKIHLMILAVNIQGEKNIMNFQFL